MLKSIMKSSLSLRLRQPASHFNLTLFLFSASKPQGRKTTARYRNIGADSLLRNYFNYRTEMSNLDMLNLLNKMKQIKMTRSLFNDHRWVHLTMTIQKNIHLFTTSQMFTILSCLKKMRYYGDLFKNVYTKLVAQVQSLTPDEQALMMYYMAKSQNINMGQIKNISDSLLINLQKSDIQMVLQKGNKIKINDDGEIQEEEEDEQKQEQSLFSNQNHQVLSIRCRNIILCFWSLQKMKIKDQLLTNCILKTFLKPNIQKIPTVHFPLLLSTLWMHNLHRKRIFQQITLQLFNREQDLLQLDLDKQKILVCTLCKPLINQKNNQQVNSELSKKRQNLILWLMETIYIKKINKQQIFHSTTFYQILMNVSEAKIFEINLFKKYLTFICQDMTRIEIKQVVYLLHIIRRIRKVQRNSQNKRRRNEQENYQVSLKNQFETLSQHLIQNMMKFLNRVEKQHPARALLRQMIFSGFIEVPNTFKKIFSQEQRLINMKQNEKIKMGENNQSMKMKKQNEQKVETNNKKQKVRRSSERNSKNKAPHETVI